ncbi:thiolase domain-containing protein [Myxococcus landrumensis]|uniref:Thiolase domain-containing protein n=1 Tax=Myxococcus landrumensis TaxID=2813577 RepID=A0ABX7NBI8_9BACT|nr:thiolase domain-containing protein [Myxococcus landrumus]QSQ14995.1 thiolase domain-containing protein [Myxococcus landrumus]
MRRTREVAIVSFAQSPSVRREWARDDVELLLPVIQEALGQAGLRKEEMGFTASGSSDFVTGLPFSFVLALDAVGAFPPIEETHVEMDGAWALYEAWVRLSLGDVDTALVYAFGRSSLGEPRDVLGMQLDPYYVAPLAPDAISLAALQARALLDSGRATERSLAEVAARSRRNAKANPNAQLSGDVLPEALLDAPYLVAPLRRHDCPPISDGAVAVVLAAGEKARAATARPAWIRGIDHRIESHGLGMRDLTRSPSTALAAANAGVGQGSVDVAEVHAPFTHQELILREALGLNGDVDLNPSGGALAANPLMSAGLIRIGEAARRVMDGSARRAVAHATSGPCLQQNLVCVLEAAP